MVTIPPGQVASYRDALQAGTDRNAHVDVGYFMIWYATVELAFTNLLAFTSGTRDLSTFDTLCAGMDLRVKIERFRRIRKTRGGVGPNLDARLRYLDDKCRPIRNRLAHCAITVSESGPDRYFASTIGSMPWREISGEQPPFPAASAIVYTPAELLGWGAWLAILSHDLNAAFRNAITTGEYEIANPCSALPSVDQGSQLRKARPAKADKYDQTLQA